MLCSLAPFFKAALDGRFKEAADNAIPMPEESIVVVRRFQLWAYTGYVMPEPIFTPIEVLESVGRFRLAWTAS